MALRTLMLTGRFLRRTEPRSADSAGGNMGRSGHSSPGEGIVGDFIEPVDEIRLGAFGERPSPSSPGKGITGLAVLLMLSRLLVLLPCCKWRGLELTEPHEDGVEPCSAEE